MKRSAVSILREDKAAAARFAEGAAKDRARRALERAQRELNERLRQALDVGPGDGSFTVAHLQAALAQVRAVLAPLTRSLGSDMMDLGADAAAVAARGALTYVQAAEDEYGLGRPLPLDTARLIDASVSGTQASLARRIAADPNHPGQPGVLARYGLATMGKFEQTLQQRLIQGKPWEAVKADLVADSSFLQGAPASWAERLLRTESMYASNRGGFIAMQGAEAVIGPMLKVLVATFDDRTGSDSYAVHGQVRRTNEAFESWFGSYMHPPNRPNDREVVVPHNQSWPLPAELKPLSDGAVAARWAQEGRKGAVPPRPLMSTVGEIGVVPPPPLPEPGLPVAAPALSDPSPSRPTLGPTAPVAYSIPAPPPEPLPPSPQAQQLARAVSHLASPYVEKARRHALGGGANVSQTLTWKDERGVSNKAVWKPAAGEEPGLRRSIRVGTYHQREAATYALDALMGGEPVVPPTLSRTVKGKAGSLQQFQPGAKTYARAYSSLPRDHLMHPSVRRMQLLDFVTANTDRHEGNWMVRADGTAVAIDNGLSFPSRPADRFLLVDDGVSRKSSIVIDEQQKALLANLDLEQVGATLFDHGLDEPAVLNTLGRIASLKANPAAMANEHEAGLAAGRYVNPTDVAERWVRDGWADHLTPEQLAQLVALVGRIKPRE